MNTARSIESNVYQDPIKARNDYISHEIRISLTGILGASYIFNKVDLTNEQKECLNLLNMSAKRLLLLADNLN